MRKSLPAERGAKFTKTNCNPISAPVLIEGWHAVFLEHCRKVREEPLIAWVLCEVKDEERIVTNHGSRVDETIQRPNRVCGLIRLPENGGKLSIAEDGLYDWDEYYAVIEFIGYRPASLPLAEFMTQEGQNYDMQTGRVIPWEGPPEDVDEGVEDEGEVSCP